MNIWIKEKEEKQGWTQFAMILGSVAFNLMLTNQGSSKQQKNGEYSIDRACIRNDSAQNAKATLRSSDSCDRLLKLKWFPTQSLLKKSNKGRKSSVFRSADAVTIKLLRMRIAQCS
jgi:hypothetical protein